MSSARIAKLEVLLSRIGARRGQPRLEVVASPVALAEPTPVADVALAEPTPVAEVALALAEPAVVDSLAHDLSPAIAFASEPEPASEPTPSVTDLAPESAHGAQLAPAAETDHTIALAAEPAPEPRVPAFAATNEPHVPAPQAPVTFSMAPSPATPSLAPPRMSLPSRPSIPSPDIVPDSLPFTLMSESTPVLPGGQESLDLAAIALSTSHTPVIDLSRADPVRVAVQPSSADIINIEATPFMTPSFVAGSAVTVVPGQAGVSASELETPSLRSARAVPPPPVVDRDDADLEPDSHAPLSIQAAPLAADAVIVASSGALPSHQPLSFGALLGRSLSLRPRADS